MYASTRVQTFPRSLILASMLVATLAIGGAAGYAVGSVAASASVTSATIVGDQLELNAAFRAGERQGSAENPDALRGPANIAFLQSEHTGSASVTSATVAGDRPELNAAFWARERQGSVENPDALQGPTNIAFLQSEHTGPTGAASGPANTAFLQSEHVGSPENPGR